MGNANANLGNAHEINQIVASIPYHRIPKGVTCYSCGTWNRVQPRVTQKHYAIARGEFVGVFFNEWYVKFLDFGHPFVLNPIQGVNQTLGRAILQQQRQGVWC